MQYHSLFDTKRGQSPASPSGPNIMVSVKINMMRLEMSRCKQPYICVSIYHDSISYRAYRRLYGTV